VTRPFREHEHEAAPGLPEALPEGERILWQGAPDWQRLAVRAFHVRKLAVYFAIILALRASAVLTGGGTAWDALVAVAWLVPLALLGIAITAVLARLSARTALYTITNRRIVMRIGIVLTVTFNIPFRAIQAADLRVDRDGIGDLPVTLKGPDRIAYLQLWPHARPWRLARPQPMLRSVRNARAVAAILSAAWSEATGAAAQPAPAAAPRAVRRPQPAMAAH
jgi:hypothetical protein